MRRVIAVFLLGAVLLLYACDTGPALDLRLFCERFNRASSGWSRLDLNHFTAQETENGMKYAAFTGMGEYVTCEVLPNGRIHTVSLTGLPDAHQKDFFVASLTILNVFSNIQGDAAERMLQEILVGTLPVLGLQSMEREGFRLSYAANEAGRYFRLSCLRHLPPEMELPTLRELITE